MDYKKEVELFEGGELEYTLIPGNYVDWIFLAVEIPTNTFADFISVPKGYDWEEGKIGVLTELLDTDIDNEIPEGVENELRRIISSVFFIEGHQYWYERGNCTKLITFEHRYGDEFTFSFEDEEDNCSITYHFDCNEMCNIKNKFRSAHYEEY